MEIFHVAGRRVFQLHFGTAQVEEGDFHRLVPEISQGPPGQGEALPFILLPQVVEFPDCIGTLFCGRPARIGVRPHVNFLPGGICLRLPGIVVLVTDRAALLVQVPEGEDHVAAAGAACAQEAVSAQIITGIADKAAFHVAGPAPLLGVQVRNPSLGVSRQEFPFAVAVDVGQDIAGLVEHFVRRQVPGAFPDSHQVLPVRGGVRLPSGLFHDHILEQGLHFPEFLRINTGPDRLRCRGKESRCHGQEAGRPGQGAKAPSCGLVPRCQYCHRFHHLCKKGEEKTPLPPPEADQNLPPPPPLSDDSDFCGRGRSVRSVYRYWSSLTTRWKLPSSI